jgi:HEAT repeat protein
MNFLNSRNVFRAGALALCGLAAAGCAVQATPTAEVQPQKVAAPPLKSQAGLRDGVNALLTGYERVPTAEDWKTLGPEALMVLEQVYADAAALPSTRSRAVASMALVDNPEAAARLRTIIDDPKADVQYRSHAVRALAFRVGEQALPQLETALADSAPAMREAAAMALGRLKSPAARRSLEGRLPNEADEAVREALHRSLGKATP